MAANAGDTPSGSGLLGSLGRLLSTVLALVQTRLEIVSTEFEEERERLRELVIYGFWTLFLISLGIILVTLWIVMALWDNWRLHALGGMAALYLAGGAWTASRLHRRLKQRQRLFGTTLDELRADRRSLGDPP